MGYDGVMFDHEPKAPAPLNPEKAEELILLSLATELRRMSTDDPNVRKECLRTAYRVATELNNSQKLGLTRNIILNLLRQEAILARVPEIDIELYKDDNGKIRDLTNQTVEEIRKEEQDKPQR